MSELQSYTVESINSFKGTTYLYKDIEEVWNKSLVNISAHEIHKLYGILFYNYNIN